ncbi:GGDEF domain-containing protein [Rhizobium sp. AG855]|uniref:GGDEF domain-containing protein n=1 Tax=Rhizobium sp. AG855 TaxID=2183898 RepID=UPI000FEFBF9F|nr:GGDEF domain-containing protein [Rhizobium sp. AG855]RKE84487.1 diguanylate cyclase (GGDEF)-like protein [Rhizobium sp. AG855]
MDHLFHIPTLSLCLSAACITVSVFVTLLWNEDRADRALAFWTLGFWAGCVGLALLSLRDVAPPIVALGFGNAFSLWSLGLVWLGCLAFDRRQLRFSFLKAFACGGIWLVCFELWPRFAVDLNMRIVVCSVLFFISSFMVAAAIWQGYRHDPLPARRLAIFAFGGHALVYLIRTPMPLLEPVTLSGGFGPNWFGLIMFIYFVQGLVGVLAIFAMVYERTLRAHKLASEIDFLTAVPNRRAFLLAVERSRQRPDESGAGAVLALVDADHFKAINDTHGHAAGDAALVALATFLSGRLPKGGVFGRLGGEEFGIYLPARQVAADPDLLERLRMGVATLDIRHADMALPVTISLGAVRLASGDVDLSMALAAADRALYASKKAGRDRLSWAEHPGTEQPTAQLHALSQQLAADTRGKERPAA